MRIFLFSSADQSDGSSTQLQTSNNLPLNEELSFASIPNEVLPLQHCIYTLQIILNG